MTPKQYLDRYTYFTVRNPRTGMIEQAPITGYGSGWTTKHRSNGPACQMEYLNGFRPALCLAVNGKAGNHPPSVFFMPTALNGLSDMDCFCTMSFIRSFLGKGSPDEIADTVRMAIALGRIGTDKDINGKRPAASTAAEYVKKFISLDCNGYSGNYYGINPETAVSGYASHARRRARAADVQVGDSVVTLTAEGSYKHVAVIAEWNCPPLGSKSTKCRFRLCEWGQAGDEAAHYTEGDAAEFDIVQGPNRAYGVGFSRNPAKSFRYIFKPPQRLKERGWGLGSDMAA